MFSAIILMAGEGKRMNMNINKILLPLGNKKVYEYSLDVFLKAVDEVIADERWRREYMVMNELIRENRRMGRWCQTVAAVRRGRGKYSSEAIAELMMVDPETVDAISTAIDAHPEWDDEEIAESLDFD